MRRFVLEQNILRFRARLHGTLSPRERAMIAEMLQAAERDLALLQAEAMGTQRYRGEFQGIHARARPAPQLASLIQKHLEAVEVPSLLLDPGPGLHILDINAHYAQATMTEATRIGGSPVFDVFPDNPEQGQVDGVSNVFASLQRAAQTGERHAMAIQRYDIRDSAGRFVERHWQPVNTPLLDESGRLLYLLHQVHDVTGEVLARRARSDRKSAFDHRASE